MSLGRWLRNHPRLLERVYQVFAHVFQWAEPLIARLGYTRADRWLRWPERLVKQIIFDCRMCGQCILRSTGMTCPMTCPKQLRNGACGGVRADGGCEVEPAIRCIWVEAFERARRLEIYGLEIETVQRPVNGQLEGTSAWINTLEGRDKEAPRIWSLQPTVIRRDA